MEHNLNPHSQKLTIFQITFTRLLALFICILLSNSAFANSASTADGFNKLIVDGLICRGNDTTECSFITKKYYQSIGDTVDPDEIADARLRLGTLQQFKNVSIVLEKASQRGMVNVVFIVNEANNIQYSLGGGYNHLGTSFFKNNSYVLNAGVTDFNFLGTGKQLSFGVASGYSKMSSDQTSKGNNLTLAYYDPHLLGSVNYYLAAGIRLSQNKQKSEIFRQEADAGLTERDTQSYAYNLSFGRRFASHSYVAVHAVGFKFKGDTADVMNLSGNSFDSFAPTFGVEYGWDSRDDLIFPTLGSAFSVFVNESIFEGDTTDTNDNLLNFEKQKNVEVRYSDNIRLNSNLIFNYGINATIDLAKLDELARQPSPTVSFGLASINSTHSADGQYKGWKYGVSLPINPDDLEVDRAELSLSYIHQTDALIVNISLGYSFELKEVF